MPTRTAPAVKTSAARRTERTDAPRPGAERRRPAFTADTARLFEATSEKSAAQVIEAIEDRRNTNPDFAGCACGAYDDVLTFDRWKGLGLSVKKGEKSLRVASFVKVDAPKAKDAPADAEQGGEAGKPRMKPHTLYLFCRCQVSEAKPGKP